MVAARRAAELAGAEHHEAHLSHAEVLAMEPEAVARIAMNSDSQPSEIIVMKRHRWQLAHRESPLILHEVERERDRREYET